MKNLRKTALFVLAIMMVGFIFLTACSSSTSTVTSVSTSTQTATSTLTTTSVTTSVMKPINLLLATTDPPGGLGGYPITTWVEEIEKRTEGRVKIDISWSSALGAESEYMDLLKNGVCDMEFVLPAIVASEVFPRSEILALPWTMDSAVAANKGMYALYKAGFFDKEYADQGLKVAAIFAAGGMADPMMFSTKNVTELADVKGLKIQAPGSVKTAMCEGMGGVPTYANIQELYLALQKGILEGMFCPYSGLETLGFAEVIDYVVTPGFGNMCGGLFMNMDTWNKLPADIQKIIEDMQEEFLVNIAMESDKINQSAIDFFVSGGGHMNTWSDEALQEMQTIFAPIWDDFIDQWNKKGVSMKEPLDLYWQTLKDSGVAVPAVGYTP